MPPLIDYALIADAVAHYGSCGYRQVEVPWLVSARACFATLPIENANHAMPVGDRFLVGSAEQGFLETDLPLGRYLAISPCFRNDVEDRFHQKTFMKVELHQTDDTSDAALLMMIVAAVDFFRGHATSEDIAVMRTIDGADIEVNGIEVGSYGRRTVNGLTWLYGTGLALPRLSIARGG
jgi:hypothetical protein